MFKSDHIKMLLHISLLILSVLETKVAEFANMEDLDEVAHNEPRPLDLHCLPPHPPPTPMSLNSQYDIVWT